MDNLKKTLITIFKRLQLLFGLLIIVYPTAIHPVVISFLGVFYLFYWFKKIYL